MKQEIKTALVELVESGGLELQIPSETMQDGLRREKPLIRELIDHAMQNGGFPRNRVQDMFTEYLGQYKTELKAHVDAHVDRLKVFRMAVVTPQGNIVETGPQHKQFGQLVNPLSVGLNVYMVGPAGSGKTTAAEQAAKALGVDFFFTGAITSEYKLTGFIDANGRVICPAFRKAYEHGGLFLFDEIDASMPQAVLAFNAAIANGMMDFPDKTVKKHAKFYCVAAANTFGVGADRIYVGRNQMDGATIDRFVFLEWGYDEDLERHLAPNAKWVKKVQAARKACQEIGLRHIISPRASIQGSKLLGIGVSETMVEKMVLWKGMDEGSISKVQSKIGGGKIDEEEASKMLGSTTSES